MSTQSYAQPEAKLQLNQILHEEIAAYDSWKKRTKDELSKIFLTAAEKLEKYVDDTSLICGILSKQWPDDARRIREYLPNKYKQTAKDTSHAQPSDTYEEFYQNILDVLTDSVDVVKTMLTEYNSAKSTNKAEEAQAMILEMFGNKDPTILKAKAEEWRELSVKLAEAKQAQDKRTRVTMFYKVLIHIQLFFGTQDSVAKKAGISPKWAKLGIEQDPRVKESFDKLCLWMFGTDDAAVLSEWFSTNIIRESKGQPALDPPFIVTVKPRK